MTKEQMCHSFHHLVRKMFMARISVLNISSVPSDVFSQSIVLVIEIVVAEKKVVWLEKNGYIIRLKRGLVRITQTRNS